MNVYDEQHDGQRAFWDDEVVVTTGRRGDRLAARLVVMVAVMVAVGLVVGLVTAAPADAARSSVAPAAKACNNPYEVVKGDGWIVIAKRAGVTTKQLLAANGATAKTKLYPDRSICLPKGASVTTAPSTTAPAAPAAAPKKKKGTTPAPPAAAPPTTAVQVRTYTASEVEAIIRQVWPDDLEDKAIQIATRESRLKPTARNWCCSGLFQIYYSVHSKWLKDIGVTNADQLLDPNVNAAAAYVLYQRAGSWKPWGG